MLDMKTASFAQRISEQTHNVTTHTTCKGLGCREPIDINVAIDIERSTQI